MELELHPEHQRADELLARRDGQPRRVPRAPLRSDRRAQPERPAHGRDQLRLPRLGRPPQQRPVAPVGPRRRVRPARRPGLGDVAAGRGLALPTPLGALCLRRRPGLPARAGLPADEGRRRVLPRLADRRRPGPAGDGPLDLAREQVHRPGRTGPCRQRGRDHGPSDHLGAVRQLYRRRRATWRRHGLQGYAHGGAGAPPDAADWRGRAAPRVARRLGPSGARAGPPPRLAPVRPAPGRADHSAGHPRAIRGRQALARAARRRRHRLVIGLESQLLGAPGRQRAGLQRLEPHAELRRRQRDPLRRGRRRLRQSVRRPSAVPDRR